MKKKTAISSYIRIFPPIVIPAGEKTSTKKKEKPHGVRCILCSTHNRFLPPHSCRLREYFNEKWLQCETPPAIPNARKWKSQRTLLFSFKRKFQKGEVRENQKTFTNVKCVVVGQFWSLFSSSISVLILFWGEKTMLLFYEDSFPAT